MAGLEEALMITQQHVPEWLQLRCPVVHVPRIASMAEEPQQIPHEANIGVHLGWPHRCSLRDWHSVA